LMTGSCFTYHAALFPLSCARVHTSRETSAHKKTWSAHKFFFKNFLCK